MCTSQEVRLYTLIGLMVLFWAGSFICGKFALREFPPLLIPGLRAALAALCLGAIYRWHDHGEQRFRRQDWPTLAVISVCGVALNQLLFIVGLSRTSVGHSSVVIALTPILVLLLAAAARQETITTRKIAGMLVALGGVATLQLARGAGAGATPLGDVFTFLGALSFSIYTVAGKRIAPVCGGVTVNTLAYAGGALVLLPLTCWQASQVAFGQISLLAWLALAYLALFPSVFAYLIYYHALTQIPASRVSAFSYLQPLVATLLAVLLLGERVTAPLVAGGTLVLAGVYVTERS